MVERVLSLSAKLAFWNVLTSADRLTLFVVLDRSIGPSWRCCFSKNWIASASAATSSQVQPQMLKSDGFLSNCLNSCSPIKESTYARNTLIGAIALATVNPFENRIKQNIMKARRTGAQVEVFQLALRHHTFYILPTCNHLLSSSKESSSFEVFKSHFFCCVRMINLISSFILPVIHSHPSANYGEMSWVIILQVTLYLMREARGSSF